MSYIASPIGSVPTSWIAVVSIGIALLFPFTFQMSSLTVGKRLRLAVAAVAGLIVVGGLGVLKGNSVRLVLFLYVDAMICLCLLGTIISFSARRLAPGEKIEPAAAKKMGYQILGFLILMCFALMLIEFA
jgi:uncharacterized membrane protein